MSKDKSKKWVISAPLFYNYAGIPKKKRHPLTFRKSRILRDCFGFFKASQ